MRYIVWKDYYSVGHPLLDLQHQQIIQIINDLHEAIEQGIDYRLVKPMLDQLFRYTVNHFKEEEQLMQACGYSELAPHKQLHDRLRTKVSDLRDNYTLVTGRDLVQFLKEWWIGHIQSEDKKYSPYLELATSSR
jgi:hemerythrin-like metal-binding protein